MNKSAALFAFMGWLTSRPQESGPFSAHHHAGQAAELVAEFIQLREWPEADWSDEVPWTDTGRAAPPVSR